MNKWQDYLAVIVIVAFSIITIVAFVTPLLADFRKEIVMCWVMNFTVIIQYRFGSSQGSKEKTELLAKK